MWILVLLFVGTSAASFGSGYTEEGCKSAAAIVKQDAGRNLRAAFCIPGPNVHRPADHSHGH